MAASDRNPQLFDLIKRRFFIDPTAAGSMPNYIGEIQAYLSVLIGNMLEWYVKGADYAPLAHDLDKYLGKLTSVNAERSVGDRKFSAEALPEHSPLVIADGWGLRNIKLPFAQPKQLVDLKGALPTVDNDTGGAIRFNHHFIGELHPQGNILALAASIAASFLNENAVIPKVSPSVTTWEKEIVRWIWHMLANQTPGDCGCSVESELTGKCKFEAGGGRIVAGGTIANLTALFMAREKYRSWLASNKNRDLKTSPLVLYSSHSHYSINRSARIVGFTYDKDPMRSEIARIDGVNYWYITGDDVANALKAAKERGQHVVMVSVLAGATDTGFVDDLQGIANVVAAYNEDPALDGPPIYFHIDAAMGGPFRLISSLTWNDQKRGFPQNTEPTTCYRGTHKDSSLLFDGIQRADAITIDGHKYFYCNYPCGGIFVQHEKEFNCLYEGAPYLESGEKEESEPEELRKIYRNLGLDSSPLADLEFEWRDRRGLRTLEGSRGIIGITQLYFTLKVFGPDGVRSLLQHTLEMTRKLREYMRATKNDNRGPVIELITCGPLNQTLFRVVSDWHTRTDPHQIKLDNQINFILPYFANWTQTGSLQKALRRSLETQDGVGASKLNSIIDRILAGKFTVPFYVGTDQLLDHLPNSEYDKRRLISAFLDYVWHINENAGPCPPKDKQNIFRWLSSKTEQTNSTRKEGRTLQVLKAVVTHPFTDETVLKKFVTDICAGASVLKEILEIKD